MHYCTCFETSVYFEPLKMMSSFVPFHSSFGRKSYKVVNGAKNLLKSIINNFSNLFLAVNLLLVKSYCNMISQSNCRLFNKILSTSQKYLQIYIGNLDLIFILQWNLFNLAFLTSVTGPALMRTPRANFIQFSLKYSYY